MCAKKVMFRILLNVPGKMVNFQVVFSVICGEIIETTKSILTKTVSTKDIPMNFNEKKVICKKKNVYI